MTKASTKHLNVARELHSKFSKLLYKQRKHIKHQEHSCFTLKLALKPFYMDTYWPGDTLIVSNVAREAKRVAHPCMS